MNWRIRKVKHQPTPSLEQQRAEKLVEMGAQLRTSRLEQGLSLEEMVILTKIPRRLLQAIEEGNLQELPEPIYIKGFIRQFADALGFNGADFSSSFPIGSNRLLVKPSWKTTPVGQLRPVHLYLLYIFLIICSVNGLSQLLNTGIWQANNSRILQLRQKETLLQSKAIQKPKSQNLELNKYILSSASAAEEVQIGVTLKEKSWIRVVADGKIKYEGELPEGTHRIWKAQEQLTIKAGNAGGVLVSINHELAKQMGEHGTVKEVTIAANRS
ncbi:MAG: helix-turn-helix domain-containing protein [Stigonema ocellatum SAG 48.90 = DSM 106950]|nr:helix-turn-helix domain-containing protein [Stigonema ocellatum SAG 48.90 = DSM 106950]